MNKWPELKVEVRTSRICEIAGIIHILGGCEYHNFAFDYVDKFKNIKKKYKHIFSKISNKFYTGFGIVEFMVKCKEFNDVNSYIAFMDSFSDDDFLNIYFGGYISSDAIADVRNRKLTTSEFLKKHSMDEQNAAYYEYILYNTDRFRKELDCMIKDIDSKYIDECMRSVIGLYNAATEKVNAELENWHPLSVAQGIMEKRFMNIAEYKHYIFIPVYFFSPHKIRYMDETTQILFINVVKRQLSVDEEREELVKALKVMSDSSRLELLRLITERPMYGKEIAEKLKITTPTVSHHIDQLKDVGLIHEERDKNTKYFSTDPRRIDALLERLKKFLYK